MSDTKEQKWPHKELKARIERLKLVERELQKLDPPREIFGSEIESIMGRLKSVPQVEEVERDLEALKQKMAQYQATLKEAASIEAKAKETLETAAAAVNEVREGAGYSLSDAEGLLSQARELINRKDYRLAAEYAAKAAQSAAKARLNISRLKELEKEFSKLEIPRDILGTEADSIRAKLKSLSHIDEVEMELEALKQKIARHQISLKEVAATEAKAKEMLKTATAEIEGSIAEGYSMGEAESLLSQAREALDRKEYSLALEHAIKAAQSAAELKSTASPQVVVELEAQNYSPGKWTAVDLGLVNQGTARAHSVELRFSQEVETKWVTTIDKLDAGARDVMGIGLKPKETGDIALDVIVIYKNAAGKDHSGMQRFWLKVGRAETERTAIGIDPGLGLLPQVKGYTLVRKIGSGGFADVYLGKSDKGNMAAIKMPRLSQYQTVESKDFLGEAELWSRLSRLKVPNIVELYEYGITPCPWIAMEYMEGHTLREHMASLDSKSCLGIAMKLMGALHSAHHHGVIHRDIKPENVLFDNHNMPKLTDWGLGKVLLEASMGSVGFKGTLVYSAPEQFDGSRFGSIDWRTDIYQMGMLVYELLTGRLPFAGAEMGTAITRIMNERPPAPSQVNRQIPADLDSAVLRALAKRKEDRFQSMDAFKDRLEHFVKVP